MLDWYTLLLRRGTWQKQAWIGRAQKPFLWLDKRKDSFLHPNELFFYRQLRSSRRKHSYLLGRFTAKQLLHKHFSQHTLHHWEIRPGVFQQPLLFGPGAGTLGISISHAENECRVIVYPIEHPMAIDMEIVRTDNHDRISSQLTASEQRRCFQSLYPDRTATVIWTAKEALSKVLHTGLLTPFWAYEVKFLRYEKDTWQHTFCHFLQYKAVSWLENSWAITVVLPRNTYCSDFVKWHSDTMEPLRDHNKLLGDT